MNIKISFTCGSTARIIKWSVENKSMLECIDVKEFLEDFQNQFLVMCSVLSINMTADDRYLFIMINENGIKIIKYDIEDRSTDFLNKD